MIKFNVLQCHHYLNINNTINTDLGCCLQLLKITTNQKVMYFSIYIFHCIHGILQYVNNFRSRYLFIKIFCIWYKFMLCTSCRFVFLTIQGSQPHQRYSTPTSWYSVSQICKCTLLFSHLLQNKAALKVNLLLRRCTIQNVLV